jgi:hypothetical protein
MLSFRNPCSHVELTFIPDIAMPLNLSSRLLLLFLLLHTSACAQPIVRFAAIGDYGKSGEAERDVARLVKGWNPEFIITLGDNNYPTGSSLSIDSNIGKYYSEFIGNYRGGYGKGSEENRFFPSLGNHDWMTEGAKPYLEYFTLPGNERYYDFIRGPVHFFVIDSDRHEPDGITDSSKQALWLRDGLSQATEPWKVVYMHHPPYSSGDHGPTPKLQWPFRQWGASVVLSGHDHTYERLERDSMLYIVNGLGGASRYEFKNPQSSSQTKYNADYGAMLIEASADQMSFRFYGRDGVLQDSCGLRR